MGIEYIVITEGVNLDLFHTDDIQTSDSLHVANCNSKFNFKINIPNLNFHSRPTEGEEAIVIHHVRFLEDTCSKNAGAFLLVFSPLNSLSASLA